MTMFAVLYGRSTNLKHLGSYDIFDDAVLCALKAGAVFDVNKIETFQQSNKRIVLLTTNWYYRVVFIERVEDGIIK